MDSCLSAYGFTALPSSGFRCISGTSSIAPACDRAINTQPMSKRAFRILVALVQLTWLLGALIAILDPEYTVSANLAEVNWTIFSAASLVLLTLFPLSTIGMQLFWKPARPAFLLYVLATLVYEYCYSDGYFGIGMGGALTQLNLILTGAVLCAAYFTEIRTHFER